LKTGKAFRLSARILNAVFKFSDNAEAHQQKNDVGSTMLWRAFDTALGLIVTDRPDRGNFRFADNPPRTRSWLPAIPFCGSAVYAHGTGCNASDVYAEGIDPGSTARDFPSLEVSKYIVDDKGNVTSTLILDKREATPNDKNGDLGHAEQPISPKEPQ
jgi:hypothetical protein